MKESDFFKQLNRELQDAAPPLSERLKEEPICSVSREKRGNGRDSRTRRRTAGRVSKKKITAILASAAGVDPRLYRRTHRVFFRPFRFPGGLCLYVYRHQPFPRADAGRKL